MCGLVSIQALVALNIYLGGNAEISRQALTGVHKYVTSSIQQRQK